MVYHRPESLVSSMLPMWGGVGRITTHLSPAGRVALAPGPARSAFSALRKAKHTQPLCIQRVYDNTWRSYIGGLRKTESGRGWLQAMKTRCGTIQNHGNHCSLVMKKRSAVVASHEQRLHQYGARTMRCIIPEQIPLLVILHYLLKNNKERSRWN